MQLHLKTRQRSPLCILQDLLVTLWSHPSLLYSALNFASARYFLRWRFLQRIEPRNGPACYDAVAMVWSLDTIDIFPDPHVNLPVVMFDAVQSSLYAPDQRFISNEIFQRAFDPLILLISSQTHMWICRLLCSMLYNLLSMLQISVFYKQRNFSTSIWSLDTIDIFPDPHVNLQVVMFDVVQSSSYAPDQRFL